MLRFYHEKNQQTLVKCHFTSYLHANDGVNEKEHCDEQADVGQRLEGLNEGPEEDADGVTLPQQFDQTGRSKQLQEAHVDRVDTLSQGRKTI